MLTRILTLSLFLILAFLCVGGIKAAHIDPDEVENSCYNQLLSDSMDIAEKIRNGEDLQRIYAVLKATSETAGYPTTGLREFLFSIADQDEEFQEEFRKQVNICVRFNMRRLHQEVGA